MNFKDKVQLASGYITHGLEVYKRVAVACSWGKDSMVLLDLARRIKPDIPVFTVVTPFKPKETNMFREQITKLWNLNLKMYQSNAEVIEGLWKTDPDSCCLVFKVQPTKEAVENLDCWFTGLRNNEGETRKEYAFIETKGGLVKINPILNWTETDIWKYSALFNVPQNPLYKQGYRSLGCKPCTGIIDDSEPERAGRWMGTKKLGGECGIHTQTLK